MDTVTIALARHMLRKRGFIHLGPDEKFLSDVEELFPHLMKDVAETLGVVRDAEKFTAQFGPADAAAQ